jgi:hypothetical protein
LLFPRRPRLPVVVVVVVVVVCMHAGHFARAALSLYSIPHQRETATISASLASGFEKLRQEVRLTGWMIAGAI